MKVSAMERIVRLGQLRWWQGQVERQRSEHRLNYLFWETTHACNLHCRHCGSDCGPRLSGELSTDEIKAAFRSISEDFDAKTIMVAVTGGEPLLRKDLFEVMRDVDDRGVERPQFPYLVKQEASLFVVEEGCCFINN